MVERTEHIVISDENLELLINEMDALYGYNFSDYSRASLKRRMQRIFLIDKISRLEEFLNLIRNEDYFSHVVEELSVTVTEMLRDPGFYKAIREKVIPVLATYPFIRVWHAGCSTGEEVYSMAILLKEAGLLHKSLLYGTDINPAVLSGARAGIFPLSQMQLYSKNYFSSGGREDFSSHYTANYNIARFDESLSRKMVFATHNLVSDSTFNSFQLICCRNVMIYFNKDLQDRVLKLFDDSLENNGFIALGSKESIRFSSIARRYRQIIPKEKIWRRIN